jgi:3-oxoacyl-[acyl-carrier protein] reductase
MRLKDKVAIVTGAGRGIGESIARRLANEGAKIVISDIDLPAAQSAVDRLKQNGKEAIAVKANVANKGEIEAMVKAAVDKFGRVDILINNAGMAVVGAYRH